MGSCTNQINLIKFNQMQVFEERAKPEYPGKNLAELRREATYDTEVENRTRATLVGGECSHHYVTTALHSL